MNYEPTDYSKVAIRQYPARNIRETAEGRYWKQFKAPVLAQQIGPITHIDFKQQWPYDFAITSSTRVLVYSSATQKQLRQFTRFKDIAYSGSFREDGKLLVAGGQDSVVQVFDAGSRLVLRQMKGHKQPVHVARFSRNKQHILSGGDDATVRLWDVTDGTQVSRLTGHSDYVRAAAASPTSVDTWATGGYDHVCHLWDVRSKQAVMKLEHGSPVEDLTFFPAGALLVSVGGTEVRVWDLLGGGRLLRRLSNHQKTVVAVKLSPRAGPDAVAAPRLLTGSLDGHVKIYELDSFKVTHASKYPAPVVSLGLSPNCSTLAVGMADGLLSIRKHARPKVITGPGAPPEKQKRRPPPLTAANFRFFMRGRNARAGVGDVQVLARRKARLAPYDRALQKFQYGAALDAALAGGQPQVVASVLEELAARGGLTAALGGRDADGLVPLLDHLRKHIAEPRYARLLINIAHRVIDIYAAVVGASLEVDEKLQQLQERVKLEVALQTDLRRLQGSLEPLLAASLGMPRG